MKFYFILIASLALSASSVLRAAPMDSIGIEKKEGKIYILHKVDPKETLFSISKRYAVAVDLIKEANPEVAQGLKMGQTIRIPSINAQSTSDNEESYSSSGKTHKVTAKETLYSISKKYNVSVDDLKKSNPAIVDGLKEGMVVSIPVIEYPKEEEQKKEKAKEAEEAKKTTVQPTKTKVEDKSVSVSAMPAAPGEKVSESGLAEVMDNNTDIKYLALHKTAPVGTVIQVKNEGNDQKIFVRVIGKLETEGNKTILKISPKAYTRLGGDPSKKMTVSISYIP